MIFNSEIIQSDNSSKKTFNDLNLKPNNEISAKQVLTDNNVLFNQNSFINFNNSEFINNKRIKEDYFMSFSPEFSASAVKPIYTPLINDTSPYGGFFVYSNKFNNNNNNQKDNATETSVLGDVSNSNATIDNQILISNPDEISNDIEKNNLNKEIQNVLSVSNHSYNQNNIGFYSWVMHGSPVPSATTPAVIKQQNKYLKKLKKMKYKEGKEDDNLEESI